MSAASSQPSEHLVFVYGTLKTGEPNAHVMTQGEGAVKLVGKGKTTREFPLIVSSPYNIPFMLAEPGKGHRIHGEVYAVDEVRLKKLDALEEYPTFYDRILEKIELSDGNFVHADVYVLKKWNDRLISDGTEFLDNYSSLGDHGRPYCAHEDVRSEAELWCKETKRQ